MESGGLYCTAFLLEEAQVWGRNGAAVYGLGRAWIEGLRTDSLYLGPVRVSQLLAGISCIAAIVVLVRQYNRIKVEKAFYAPEQDKADEKKGE